MVSDYIIEMLVLELERKETYPTSWAWRNPRMNYPDDPEEPAVIRWLERIAARKSQWGSK